MDAIVVSGVKKAFRVYFDKGASLKEKLLFQNRNTYEQRTVLNGVSFSVQKGEAVGLIGKNGCGKSTMLKLLTKIMYPDAGTITVTGRVSSLIELGAGFHPDMSGRENIYTNAAIFGLTRQEIEERLQKIIEFSELHDFIDNPVRTYSSGMYMRLAFSVAINVDADVLLIDEILAVGDAAFQAKCFCKLREIKAQGTTIVIVSHSLGQIEEFCERTIWIDHGQVRQIDKPVVVHPFYMDYMNGISSESSVLEHGQSGQVEDSAFSENPPTQECSRPWPLSFLAENSHLPDCAPIVEKGWLRKRILQPIADWMWRSIAPALAHQSAQNAALIELGTLLYDENCRQAQQIEQQALALQTQHASATYFAETLAHQNFLLTEMEKKQAELQGKSTYCAETLAHQNFLLTEMEKKQAELQEKSTYCAETLQEKSFLISQLAADLNGVRDSGVYCSEMLQSQNHRLLLLEEKLQAMKQTETYVIETLESQSYWIEQGKKALSRQRIAIQREEIRAHYRVAPKAAPQQSGTLVQLVPVLKQWDAIGNYALALKRLMDAQGIQNRIVYLEADSTLAHLGQPYEQAPWPLAEDVLLLHMAAETLFADLLDAYGCKRVLVYHNITPPDFFPKGSFARTSSENGLAQVRQLCNRCDACIVSSHYNRHCLEEMGYTIPIHVVPLYVEHSDWAIAPSQVRLKALRDGKRNFLFVGRIAPNKCQHDVIAAYTWYRNNISKESRLLLVGKYESEDAYYQSLISSLPSGVELTGSLPQTELNACYQAADVFICASEHEGVCVPLLEAMYFSIPVLAYCGSAVPETLGEGGVLMDGKDPEAWGRTMEQLCTDMALKERIHAAQQRQLALFAPQAIAGESISLINQLLR